MTNTADRADLNLPVAEGAPSRLRHLAWPLGALGLLMPVGTAILVFLNRSAIHSLDQANPVELILPYGFAIIGAILVSRGPRNTIGWIFLGIAIFGGFPGVATQYVFRNWHFHRLPFAAWVAWTHDWCVWLVFPSGLAAFFFLLFPDGHLSSRRWRWLAWAAGVLMATGAALFMLQGRIELNGSPSMRNPIGLRAVDMNNGAPGLIWLFGILVLIAAMVGTILRTRRSSGEQRQQLRWLGYAAAITAFGLVAAFPFNSTVSFDVVIVLGFGVAVPVSCGIAVLKHGLYEIDVVVSKTVVYGVLAAFFTAVYVAVVVGIGTAIGSTRNPFLTLLAAALIALAFNPVRDRAKRIANGLVYGKRASPYEVVSEFAERMGGTFSLEDVLPRMAQILGEGTGARQAKVWLRVGDELRPAGSWGSPAGSDEPLPITDGELPAVAGASRSVAVRHDGDLLGALTVTKPPNEPLTTAEGKLVDDLAAQAGLVLRNVGLTEDLRANLAALRASRQRIVAAQDQARRRLERDIHDGAQQQLVALAVKTRLADSLIGRDEAKAHEVLRQVQNEAQEALDNLRELARGIYPPLLADQGLAVALQGQARKASLPVTVEANGISRYPEDAEAAVYFCVLEGLQNVAKYARASSAVVRLSQTDGSLTFEVTDDGQGFDVERLTYGTGLQGIADRLAALDGTLEVRSTPGRGTTLRGTVPVRAG